MKQIYKYRYEFAAFLLAVGFFTIILYWRVTEPNENTIGSLLFISFAADCVLLYFTLRHLWRTKWKKKMVTSAQRIIQKLAKVIVLFLEKWNLTQGKSKNVLSGKTTVSFDFPLPEIHQKKRSKPLKWKNLQNDRERLGFLYRQIITQKIQSGIEAKASNTPLELKDICEVTDAEEELFSMYIDYRYDERKRISSEKIMTLKNNIDN